MDTISRMLASNLGKTAIMYTSFNTNEDYELVFERVDWLKITLK